MSKSTKCPKCHGLGYYDKGHENDDGTMSGGNYVDCELCNKDAGAERYKRMFEAACVDLGAINARLGLDPNAGGAGPIIDAINKMEKPWSIVAWRYEYEENDCARWKITEAPPWKWNTTLAIKWEPLYAKREVGIPETTSDVIAGLEMALSQADAMIERQQHAMQRAMDAWDTTTHQKNADGRLWQCMEELRMEIIK